MTWGTDIEIERRNRIRVALYAYSYEIKNDSLVSDGEFDKLALQIRPQMNTTDDITDPEQKKRYYSIDRFFREEFQPDTGQWIYKHPDLDGLERLYVAIKTQKWTQYHLQKGILQSE